MAASPVLRLAVEIGCGIPYEARTDGTVLLPPLTVADLLAMLYPPPIRTAAWRRNRWERVASALRGLERMCSAADPQRRPAFEILSSPGATPDPEDEVHLAVHAPTGDNGPEAAARCDALTGAQLRAGLVVDGERRSLLGSAPCAQGRASLAGHEGSAGEVPAPPAGRRRR